MNGSINNNNNKKKTIANTHSHTCTSDKITRFLNNGQGRIYIGVFDQFTINLFIYGATCDKILV